jgi:hypothetical protein
MKLRTAVATALALVTLTAPAAQAMIPSDHDGVSASKPVLKRLPKTPDGSRTTKPARRPAGVSALSQAASYRESAAAIRRNG